MNIAKLDRWPVSPARSARLQADLGSAGSATRDGAIVTTPLTRREREVLCLVAHGFSNRMAAARLGVSAFTVKRHVSNILGKLGLPTRAAAAAYAARRGLL